MRISLVSHKKKEIPTRQGKLTLYKTPNTEKKLPQFFLIILQSHHKKQTQQKSYGRNNAFLRLKQNIFSTFKFVLFI